MIDLIRAESENLYVNIAEIFNKYRRHSKKIQMSAF